jgi:hypothetical protein
MAQPAALLVGPCLEKICEVASGRKYTKLRHEAKVCSTLAFGSRKVFYDDM